MRFEDRFADDLRRIRDWCQKNGTFSWTTQKYQNDILNFIYENRDRGGCIVEVGCYKGGLTALLAFACEIAGLKLVSLDVDPLSITSAKSVLAALGFAGQVHQSTLPNFRTDAEPADKPLLCILDGDHEYNAVVADIDSCLKFDPRPHAIAFHDYSLRHPTTNERVSDAIDAEFGEHYPRIFIGQTMNGEGHATKESPQPDGHWWQVPGSEGAIVVI